MTSVMSVVVSKVETLNLRIELRNKWTMYIDGRPCQAVPGCQVEVVRKLSGLQSNVDVHAPQPIC
jgi:hypothetical protein